MYPTTWKGCDRGAGKSTLYSLSINTEEALTMISVLKIRQYIITVLIITDSCLTIDMKMLESEASSTQHHSTSSL